MPTTQPLDDELGDIFEGQLRPIAGFGQQSGTSEERPQTKVPHVKPSPVPSTANAGTPSASTSQPRSTTLRITNLKTPGRGLSGVSKAPEVQKPVVAPPAEPTSKHENKPYSPDDVKKVWLEFTELHRPEHLLVNAMRVAMPAHIEENTFRIAQSAIHLNFIRENIDRITGFVRTRLNNDNIGFELLEVSEDSPMVWNERELLQHIVKENPHVGDFINDLDLKLL